MSSSYEENRVRAKANGQGYAVRKSRLRDHFARHYKTVWLIPTEAAIVSFDGTAEIGPFTGLAQVEEWLNTEPNQRLAPAELEKRLVTHFYRGLDQP